MADLNSFSLTGRLTQNAAINTTANGKKILTANCAVNTGFGNYKKTLFVKVQQWGDNTSNLIPYLKKGQLIGCSGELSRSEWQNKEGKTYVDFVVTTFGIQLLGSKLVQSESSEQDTNDEQDTELTF